MLEVISLALVRLLPSKVGLVLLLSLRRNTHVLVPLRLQSNCLVCYTAVSMIRHTGILTVAEDLLKNDGQKFLEMMESLADKRIQRERAEEDGFSVTSSEFDRDEEEYDDEEDEEGDEEDEDELEDEEGEEGVEEPLTEEQKMEEGRKMFQVFAARMFEQRVLTAYREMVSIFVNVYLKSSYTDLWALICRLHKNAKISF